MAERPLEIVWEVLDYPSIAVVPLMKDLNYLVIFQQPEQNSQQIAEVG